MSERDDAAKAFHNIYLITAKTFGWPVRPEVDGEFEQLSKDAQALDYALADFHWAEIARLRAEWQDPFLRHDPKTGETNIIRCENCDALQRRVEALEAAAKVILQECQDDVLGTEYSSPGIRALGAALHGEEAG